MWRTKFLKAFAQLRVVKFLFYWTYHRSETIAYFPTFRRSRAEIKANRIKKFFPKLITKFMKYNFDILGRTKKRLYKSYYHIRTDVRHNKYRFANTRLGFFWRFTFKRYAWWLKLLIIIYVLFQIVSFYIMAYFFTALFSVILFEPAIKTIATRKYNPIWHKGSSELFQTTFLEKAWATTLLQDKQIPRILPDNKIRTIPDVTTRVDDEALWLNFFKSYTKGIEDAAQNERTPYNYYTPGKTLEKFWHRPRRKKYKKKNYWLFNRIMYKYILPNKRVKKHYKPKPFLYTKRTRKRKFFYHELYIPQYEHTNPETFLQYSLGQRRMFRTLPYKKLWLAYYEAKYRLWLNLTWHQIMRKNWFTRAKFNLDTDNSFSYVKLFDLEHSLSWDKRFPTFQDYLINSRAYVPLTDHGMLATYDPGMTTFDERTAYYRTFNQYTNENMRLVYRLALRDRVGDQYGGVYSTSFGVWPTSLARTRRTKKRAVHYNWKGRRWSFEWQFMRRMPYSFNRNIWRRIKTWKAEAWKVQALPREGYRESTNNHTAREFLFQNSFRTRADYQIDREEIKENPDIVDTRNIRMEHPLFNSFRHGAFLRNKQFYKAPYNMESIPSFRHRFWDSLIQDYVMGESVKRGLPPLVPKKSLPSNWTNDYNDSFVFVTKKNFQLTKYLFSLLADNKKFMIRRNISFLHDPISVQIGLADEKKYFFIPNIFIQDDVTFKRRGFFRFSRRKTDIYNSKVAYNQGINYVRYLARLNNNSEIAFKPTRMVGNMVRQFRNRMSTEFAPHLPFVKTIRAPDVGYIERFKYRWDNEMFDFTYRVKSPKYIFRNLDHPQFMPYDEPYFKIQAQEWKQTFGHEPLYETADLPKQFVAPDPISKYAKRFATKQEHVIFNNIYNANMYNFYKKFFRVYTTQYNPQQIKFYNYHHMNMQSGELFSVMPEQLQDPLISHFADSKISPLTVPLPLGFTMTQMQEAIRAHNNLMLSAWWNKARTNRVLRGKRTTYHLWPGIPGNHDWPGSKRGGPYKRGVWKASSKYDTYLIYPGLKPRASQAYSKWWSLATIQNKNKQRDNLTFRQGVKFGMHPVLLHPMRLNLETYKRRKKIFKKYRYITAWKLQLTHAKIRRHIRHLWGYSRDFRHKMFTPRLHFWRLRYTNFPRTKRIPVVYSKPKMTQRRGKYKKFYPYLFRWTFLKRFNWRRRGLFKKQYMNIFIYHRTRFKPVYGEGGFWLPNEWHEHPMRAYLSSANITKYEQAKIFRFFVVSKRRHRWIKKRGIRHFRAKILKWKIIWGRFTVGPYRGLVITFLIYTIVFMPMHIYVGSLATLYFRGLNKRFYTLLHSAAEEHFEDIRAFRRLADEQKTHFKFALKHLHLSVNFVRQRAWLEDHREMSEFEQKVRARIEADINIDRRYHQDSKVYDIHQEQIIGVALFSPVKVEILTLVEELWNEIFGQYIPPEYIEAWGLSERWFTTFIFNIYRRAFYQDFMINFKARYLFKAFKKELSLVLFPYNGYIRKTYYLLKLARIEFFNDILPMLAVEIANHVSLLVITCSMYFFKKYFWKYEDGDMHNFMAVEDALIILGSLMIIYIIYYLFSPAHFIQDPTFSDSWQADQFDIDDEEAEVIYERFITEKEVDYGEQIYDPDKEEKLLEEMEEQAEEMEETSEEPIRDEEWDNEATQKKNEEVRTSEYGSIYRMADIRGMYHEMERIKGVRMHSFEELEVPEMETIVHGLHEPDTFSSPRKAARLVSVTVQRRCQWRLIEDLDFYSHLEASIVFTTYIKTYGMQFYIIYSEVMQGEHWIDYSGLGQSRRHLTGYSPMAFQKTTFMLRYKVWLPGFPEIYAKYIAAINERMREESERADRVAKRARLGHIGDAQADEIREEFPEPKPEDVPIIKKYDIISSNDTYFDRYGLTESYKDLMRRKQITSVYNLVQKYPNKNLEELLSLVYKQFKIRLYSTQFEFVEEYVDKTKAWRMLHKVISETNSGYWDQDDIQLATRHRIVGPGHIEDLIILYLGLRKYVAESHRTHKVLHKCVPAQDLSKIVDEYQKKKIYKEYLKYTQ